MTASQMLCQKLPEQFHELYIFIIYIYIYIIARFMFLKEQRLHNLYDKN